MTRIRTIELLVLSALALVAVGAFSATGAQAGTFTAGQYPATIVGTNNVPHTITTNLGAIECAPFFHGKLEAASEQLTLEPSYGTCSLGAKEVHTDMNGCDFLLHAGETMAGDKVGGTMDIVCPEGSSIDFEVTSVPVCHLTVPGQTGLSALTFTNRTPPSDVDLDFNLTGLAYGLDMGCPGPGTYANGTWTGITTLVAFKGPGMQTAFGVD
ncbi:MAG TPA: hypothetical protein VFN92_00870 [Solirubrobacterales bacterium]|nr:hypothetical protein [Solirubrobacterales bacterium]